MLKDNIQSSLNTHINKELYSSYLYFSMAAYCSSISLPGFEHWMKVQAQEELTHAIKFYDFINQRDGRISLSEIEQPPFEWKSPLDVFNEVYQHEIKVTHAINDLVALARKENDFASENFLQWFVAEQVEEEATVSNILEQLKMIGDSKQALLLLDTTLVKRIATTPNSAGETN